MLADAAWLHACLQPAANSATLEISCDSSDLPDVWSMLSEYEAALGVLNLDVRADIDNRRVHAHGPGAATLLAGENGMHIRQGWYKVRVAAQAVAAEVVRIADARVVYDAATGWLSEPGASELATLMMASLELPDGLAL